jgi:hypothetical protein
MLVLLQINVAHTSKDIAVNEIFHRDFDAYSELSEKFNPFDGLNNNTHILHN